MVDCPFFGSICEEFEGFIPLRTRRARTLMKKTDVNKATGPDNIPAVITKDLADVLAFPFTKICRRLLAEGCWPRHWRLHRICPLYKRNSAFQAKNYRGVHLTTIFSKLAEKLIGERLGKFLQAGKFGYDQWAFTPGLSSRDLITSLVMSWILAICSGKKVSAFLGDITGAFDRVFKDYLMAKLHCAGVGSIYMNFLDAYLQPRQAEVVVEGVASDKFTIQNTVFQGTVLGPMLWNLFFADVSFPAASTGGNVSKFADDLNVFQTFNKETDNGEILRVMHVCRDRVHRWGRLNRVAFDATKEHLAIIHPLLGEGDDFKLLGCQFDCKLIMRQAVENILGQMRPKISAILKTKPYYKEKDLIGQFKTHVWGIMEQNNGAIFHASNYLLDRLDACQRHFLHEIDMTEADAFLKYNFGTPSLRRDIGILGLLHKRVLGKAHPVFQDLLPFHREDHGASTGSHSKQLYGRQLEIKFQVQLHHRSIFSMVHIYNRLSQNTVNSNSVSAFQSQLTRIERERCMRGDPDWMKSFSVRG